MHLKGARRLLKLADFLETVPRQRFNMGEWATSLTHNPVQTNLVPELSCGTTACALGWATVPFRREMQLVRDNPNSAIAWVKGTGKWSWASDTELQTEFFGLDDDERNIIFYDETHTPKAKANQIRKLVKSRALDLIRG